MDFAPVGQSKTELKGLWSEVWDWIKFFVGLALVCLLLNNLVGLSLVSGHSMAPTLRDGSVLLINKLSVHTSQPDYGDVVVIAEGNRDIIKRVVGLPGDTVSINQGTVYVNQVPVLEIYTLGQANNMSEVVVPNGEFFFLGDNRTPGESLDSRAEQLGTEPIGSIKGYAVVSLYPFYKIMKPLEL